MQQIYNYFYVLACLMGVFKFVVLVGLPLVVSALNGRMVPVSSSVRRVDPHPESHHGCHDARPRHRRHDTFLLDV